MLPYHTNCKPYLAHKYVDNCYRVNEEIGRLFECANTYLVDALYYLKKIAIELGQTI